MSPVHIAVHPVVPDVKVGAGGGIRALGVDHELVGKVVLVQPGRGGQVGRPASVSYTHLDVYKRQD